MLHDGDGLLGAWGPTVAARSQIRPATGNSPLSGEDADQLAPAPDPDPCARIMLVPPRRVTPLRYLGAPRRPHGVELAGGVIGAGVAGYGKNTPRTPNVSHACVARSSRSFVTPKSPLSAPIVE